jgi:hypothetical protein
VTNPSSSTDRLARRLVADVALQARQKPNRWVMLGDIVPKLGVSWLEAEAAARFAAAKPREWIEHNTHSLMLRQAGRQMLNEEVDLGGDVESDGWRETAEDSPQFTEVGTKAKS